MKLKQKLGRSTGGAWGVEEGVQLKTSPPGEKLSNYDVRSNKDIASPPEYCVTSGTGYFKYLRKCIS